jgi:LysM repeat protein
MNRTILGFLAFCLVLFTNSIAMAKIVTVQKGDNFWKIAQRYKVSWNQIQQINESRLIKKGNYNLLIPGQIIEIPTVEKIVGEINVFAKPAIRNACIMCHNQSSNMAKRQNHGISKGNSKQRNVAKREFKANLDKMAKRVESAGPGKEGLKVEKAVRASFDPEQKVAAKFSQLNFTKSEDKLAENKEDVLIVENPSDKRILKIKDAKQEGVYVTRQGDTLEKLSQLWWGTPKYAGVIAKHNGLSENLKQISNGKVIFIPEDVGTIEVIETNMLAYGAKGVKGDEKVLKAIDLTVFSPEAKQAMKHKVSSEDPESIVVAKGELANCVSDYYGVLCNPSGFKFLWKDAEKRNAKAWKNIKIPGRICRISVMDKGGDLNLRCEIDVSETKQMQNDKPQSNQPLNVPAVESSLSPKATEITKTVKADELDLKIKPEESVVLENVVARKLVIPKESNFSENFSSYQKKPTPNPLPVNQFESQSLRAQPLLSSEFVPQRFLPKKINSTNIDGVDLVGDSQLSRLKDERVITYSPGVDINKPKELSYSPLQETIERVNFQKNEKSIFLNYTSKY